MTRLTRARRVAVLGLSSAACAVASVATVSLRADSWVRSFAFAVAVVPTLLGFGVSVVLLWDVNLARAIPLVAIVTVATSIAAGALAPVLGLVVGVLAMHWCRNYSGWRF